MLAAPLLLSALLAAQQTPTTQEPDLTKKVNYEANALPARRSVQELGAKAGVSLDVSQQMYSPVLVLRLTDVPLKDAMDRIAAATSGEWLKEEGGTYRLIRSNLVQNREANEERQAEIAEIRQAIKRFVDSQNPKPASPAAGQKADEEEEEEMDFQIPGFGVGGAAAKAIAKLVSRIDPSVLAAANDDSRIVFSTSPTRMQRPMPPNSGPVFAELIAEHNKAAASRPERGQEEKTEEERQLEEFMKLVFGETRSDQPVEVQPAKALLIASKGRFGFGMSLELRLYGPRGKVVLRGSHTLMIRSGMFGEMMQAASGADPAKGRPAPAGEDKPIELSPTTRELVEYFRSFSSGNPSGKTSPSLEELLARPDLRDPLSFVPGESVLAVAKARNLNLVANLPDDMVSLFDFMFDRGGMTVNGFLNQLETSRETKVQIKDGWMTVRPAKPENARKKRQDRSALAALIAAARSKGAPSLDDFAAYALRCEPPMQTPLAMTYLTVFAPNAMSQGFGGPVDWDMLRLYGTLSIQQRQALADKAEIAFASLAPVQRGYVQKMAFGPDTNLKVLEPGEQPTDEPGGFLEMMRQWAPGRQDDFRQEPTEAMPNGLPPNGTLRMTLTEETVGTASGQGAMLRMFGVLGADELALLRWFTEEPSMQQFGQMMPKIEGMRLGTRRAYRFVFGVARQVTFEHTLNDDRVDPKGSVIAMDALPEEMKSKIAKRLEQLKKSPFPMFPAFGREVPPPPR